MQTLVEYLDRIRTTNVEAQRTFEFLFWLRDRFGILETDVEQPAPGAAFVRSGFVDAVVGDLYFEFKVNIARDLERARSQLIGYLGSAHAQNPKRPVLGIATDGVVFHVYRPRFLDDQPPELDPIDTFDLSVLDEREALIRLDAYLFRTAPKIPTEEDVAARYGPNSPTYRQSIAALQDAFRTIKDEPPVALKYELWQRQLTFVYGDAVGGEELFLQHTYLATVAKVLAAAVFGRVRGDPRDVVSGGYFRGVGIENFIEEDLFSWLLHPLAWRSLEQMVAGLGEALRLYDVDGFSEDVLKGLYERLVDPEIRHDLGEYYTPDWLAERMLRKVLVIGGEQRILDPACGSGTFLFTAVRLIITGLRNRKWSQARILTHLASHVCGIDLHPLAVLVARTNYLLACAPLLRGPRETFRVPIYLGDSLLFGQPPGLMASPDIEPLADGETLGFPGRLAEDPELLDSIVSVAVEYAGQGEAGTAGFATFLRSQPLEESERAKLSETLAALRRLSESGRDSIWGFYVRNMIRPYIFARQANFDLVVGNPPWLRYAFMKDARFRDEFKQRSRAFGVLPSGGNLSPHYDLAALFFAECVFRYLKGDATIAFVMPRGALGGPHYAAFNQFTFGQFAVVECTEVWDLEEVRPLFEVPACVIFARKARETSWPIIGHRLEGNPPRRNASFEEAEGEIRVSEYQWNRPEAGNPSIYKDRFHQGATIVPRRFWFVRSIDDPVLGGSGERPRLQSDDRVGSKPPWTRSFVGNVERQFLWSSLLAQDILPFAIRPVRTVIIPADVKSGGHLELMASEDALRKGYPGLSGWLESIEHDWESHRGTGLSSTMSAVEWLNYANKLTAQFPRMGRWLILYAASASFLASCILDTGGENQGLKFVADAKLYVLDVSSENEALYLSAWLNSPNVDRAIKVNQSRGQWGPRDIHKLPLGFPLPKFNSNDATHMDLARLSRLCREAAKPIADASPNASVGSLRSRIRAHPSVQPLLTEIGNITVALVPSLVN